MSNNILLISIKPKYAKQIINGNKTVELRRVRTRLQAGDLVLVYVTSPQQELVGYFDVEKVAVIENLDRDIDKFWKTIKECACVEYSEFKNYYQGASIGAALSRCCKLLQIVVS